MLSQKKNPADLNSRSIHLNVFLQTQLWWPGPKFLQKDVELIVKNKIVTDTDKRKAVVTCFLIVVYILYNKLVRIYSYVFKFILYVRNKIQENKLRAS